MKILFIGDLNEHARSFQRYNAIKDLGHDVIGLSFVSNDNKDSSKKHSLLERVFHKAGFPLDNTGINQRALDHIEKHETDLIWVEKGLMVKPKTLKEIKYKFPFCKLVYYSNDNMSKKHNNSYYFNNSLKYCDFCVTIKGYNPSFLLKKGCNNVIAVDRSHDKSLLSYACDRVYKHDVLFIGTYEKNRYELLKFLASNGVNVIIYGNNWPQNDLGNLIITNKAVYGDAFIKIIQSSKVVLNFLRKLNNDTTTGRTFEIPACGAFMLTERTKEHLRLFAEDKEAAYFDVNNPDELLKKVEYFLENDEERLRIAKAGRERCLNSGFSHHDRLEKILREIG